MSHWLLTSRSLSSTIGVCLLLCVLPIVALAGAIGVILLAIKESSKP